MAEDKIFIQIDDERIELTGQAKEDFLADRKATNDRIELEESLALQKEEARKSAINKLAEIAGLTEDEIKAVLGRQHNLYN